MSIGRIIKKRRSGDEDVLSIIDKFTMPTVKYDFEEIRNSIKELSDYADKEVREDDEFMKIFFKLYSNIYGERPRSKGVFHPSSIMSDCERKMYYEFMGFEETDEVFNRIDAKLKRTFDVGTWWHTYIQMILWKSGILEKSEVRVRNRKKRISGHCDGILRLNKRTLLEIKTMNSFSYAKGKHKPFVKHEQQAGTYANELGIEQICYIYINKDTSEIVTHIKPVNKELVEKVNEKMDLVLEAVEDEIAPKREHCKTESSPMAQKCPYVSLCFTKRRGRR